MREILEKLFRKEISVDEAMIQLQVSSIQKLGDIARLDVGREERTGVPEIILAEGKSAEDVAGLAIAMCQSSGRAIVSRLSPDHLDSIKGRFTQVPELELQIYDRARIVVLKKRWPRRIRSGGKIAIFAAGTHDISVAEEARVISQELGCDVFTAYDVGVAGLHRLAEPISTVLSGKYDVIVVVAGREGALPSVIAGLVDMPVIAVPTSSGYGLGEKGLGALMAMLQACSLGIAVVNIDAGVAAGVMAAKIANRIAAKSSQR